MPLLAPVSVQTPAVQVAPPPQVRRFRGLSMTWTGWDGSVWELTQSSAGVFLTDGGVRGLHMPPVQRYTSQSPSVPGSRWRGSRTGERECFWPLFVYSDESSQAWLERDRAFWRTMRPDQLGTWSVTDPGGVTRSLACRFSDSEDSLTRDPVAFGWNLYGITLVAEQPFWSGPPVVRSFTAGAGVPFFGGVGEPGGPPFYPSRGNTAASAKVDNPGDVDVYPVYVLNGPVDSGATVGVGSKVTTYGAAVVAGKSVVIDHRPGRRGARQIDTPTVSPESAEWWALIDAAVDSGDDMIRAGNVTQANFQVAPIAPGEAQALAINFTGTGAIHVGLNPLHYRAY